MIYFSNLVFSIQTYLVQINLPFPFHFASVAELLSVSWLLVVLMLHFLCGLSFYPADFGIIRLSYSLFNGCVVKSIIALQIGLLVSYLFFFFSFFLN